MNIILRIKNEFTGWGLAISALAVFFVYFFYSLNSGITITNDGSHFALFDSLVETGSPELQQVRQFAFGDSAEYDGRYFSDRNPGLALSTYVFYQGVRGLEGHMSPLRLDPKFARSYTKMQRSRIQVVMLVPALSGGLVFLFTFLLVRELGVERFTSLISATATLLGTICLRYGTVFYSHMFAAGLLVFSLLMIFRSVKHERSNLLPIGAFALSLAVLVEHLLIVVFFPVVIYLVICRPDKLLTARGMARVTLAGLLPMLVLMVYNWVCFDSPFSIAHFHHASDKANHHLGTLLRFDQVLVAAGNLLFGAPESEVGRQDLLGLFSDSPFLYFAFLFFPLAILKHRKVSREDLVLIASVVLLILGGASVFAPYGGWDRDYRYFLAATPLFAPFIGYVLDFLLDAQKYLYAKYVAIAAFMVLTIISVQTQVEHVRHNSQVQYSTLFVNVEAAVTNVSLVFAFIITPIVLSVLVARVALKKS